MKRIGLISDTHNHFDEKVIKYFSEVDEIWHAGDIGELEITDRLAEIAPLRAVYGNIDGHKVRSEFPEHLKFTMEGVRVWMTHIGGRPYVYDYRIREEVNRLKPDLFICGHTHICKVQMDKRIQTLYMNPGAAGVHGIHKVKTILRFSLDLGAVKDLEVIELGPRAKG